MVIEMKQRVHMTDYFIVEFIRLQVRLSMNLIKI